MQPKPTLNQPKLRAGLKRSSFQTVSSLGDIPEDITKASGDTLIPKDVTENPSKNDLKQNDSVDLNKMVSSPPSELTANSELKNSTGNTFFQFDNFFYQIE